MHQIIEETQGLCPMCGGTGQVRQYNCTAMYTTCERCGGSGFIVTSRTYRIMPDPAEDAEA